MSKPIEPSKAQLPTANALFVYGTLAPGKPNEHMLANLKGHWAAAKMKGYLVKQGWGAALGYPGLVLDEKGDDVHGLVFLSAKLSDHWDRLDEFEGPGYERLSAVAELEDGAKVDVQVYALKNQN